MTAEPERPRAPDFSTKFWKEFRLTHPRPAVYIPVGVAYLLFLAVMVSFSQKTGPVAASVVAVCLLGLAFAPGLVLARHFAGRQRRLELREALARLPGTDRVPAVAAWCGRELLRAAVAPALALGLLIPFFLSSGWMILDCAESSRAALFLGLSLLAQAVAIALLSAAVGAASGALLPAARAGWTAASAMGLAVLVWVEAVRLIGPSPSLPLPGGEGWGEGTTLAVWVLAGAVLCAFMAAAVLRALPGFVGRRLASPEDPGYADQDALGEGAEGMGLGVSFWALFKWRFWADPFFGAERRSLWSRRRLLHLWGALSLAMVAVLVMASLNRGNEVAGGLLRQFLVWLPVLVAPAIMAVGLSGERASGAVESVLLTPVAPLRLAAAKLLGRGGHLLIAAVLLVLLAPIMVGPALEEFTASAFLRSSRDPWVVFGENQTFWMLRELCLAPLAALAAGAAGLYGAARFRTMTGALTAGYSLALLLLVVLALGVGFTAEFTHHYWDWVSFSLKTVVFLIEVLLLAAMARLFLMSAARRLALAKDG